MNGMYGYSGPGNIYHSQGLHRVRAPARVNNQREKDPHEFTTTKRLVEDVEKKIKTAKETSLKEYKLSSEMATEASKADAERFECPVCFNIIEGLKIC